MGLLLLAASGALGLLILTALALFFIPVIVEAALGLAPGSGHALLRVSWGLFGARVRREGRETRIEWLFGGRPVRSRVLEGKRPADGRPVGKGTPLTLFARVRILLRLAGPVFSFGWRVLGATTLEEVRGRLRVGLGDPADTGMLFGGYCALAPLLGGDRVCLQVTPVFDRQVLDGEISARFRIDRPLILAAAGVRLYLNPDVKAAVSLLRGGQG